MTTYTVRKSFKLYAIYVTFGNILCLEFEIIVFLFKVIWNIKLMAHDTLAFKVNMNRFLVEPCLDSGNLCIRKTIKCYAIYVNLTTFLCTIVFLYWKLFNAIRCFFMFESKTESTAESKVVPFAANRRLNVRRTSNAVVHSHGAKTQVARVNA